MKHKLLIVLLGLGTIAGYGASCASLHGHHRHADRFENHVAEVCAAAAHRVYDQRSQPAPQAPATIVVPWAYPTPAIPPPTVTPAPNTTPPTP